MNADDKTLRAPTCALFADPNALHEIVRARHRQNLNLKPPVIGRLPYSLAGVPKFGSLEMLRTPTEKSEDTTSLSRSRGFPLISPGRCCKSRDVSSRLNRLATSPVPTGSPAAPMTIGIVVVAFSGSRSRLRTRRNNDSQISRRTISAAISASRLSCPSAYLVFNDDILAFNVSEFA